MYKEMVDVLKQAVEEIKDRNLFTVISEGSTYATIENKEGLRVYFQVHSLTYDFMFSAVHNERISEQVEVICSTKGIEGIIEGINNTIAGMELMHKEGKGWVCQVMKCRHSLLEF
ncbi:hypothetical protein BigBertha_261 [Bacillus phage BigBertha]|uniref:Uncharacterized protein n=1 Tax=Bacillus phage BigBertha TaxID=1406781 RepID=U5PSA0_9CAUD|nr:hypothetical protein BigBertha_261 [Bacillus phage BigBertha]YP_009290141.1 hypothetical protein BI003_gp262 [Bacillus phage Phrodo]QDH49961.1 hypothetical protein BEYONPHE_274 [Bacillus phage Beyonphe]UGO50564.1 hypothetical protein RONSWANSON_258 [Bacillus phage vB_BanH_RonSwanson]AGY46769.1 hypothetical protein BigBertha_261 [Bacillus phage BigBertha]AMW62302.1 hypothetical protein PHRODO_262 [Bacillus phage Phrodo]